MIEIRISNTAAVQLLVDRIENEFKSRIKIGIYNPGLTLDELPFNELFDLAEIAAFDLVSILPFDVLLKETNIDEIITKAMQSLAVIYQKTDFTYYSKEMAELLVAKLKQIYALSEKEKLYIKN